MTNTFKRGNTYHFDGYAGGQRLRCSLGVREPKAAQRLANRVAYAICDGPKSEVWTQLRSVLPQESFKVLSAGTGVFSPTLKDFQNRYFEDLERRKNLGEIAEGTFVLYLRIAENFFKSVRLMDDLTTEFLDDYLAKRKLQIAASPRHQTGRSWETERRVLASMFTFGVEHNYLKSSPIRKGLKSEWPETEAKPYSSDEMNRMEENCDDLRLAFLLLKWTGLRRSDAAEVTWSAIDWSSQTLRWRTKKRKKTVTIPLHPELLAELSINRKADGPILGMTAPQLYTHIKRLGKKAQIKDCHPHRFRCTLAVTMLQNGATLYEVAQILGDESATVEKHYAAFTDGLQERVRGILESS